MLEKLKDFFYDCSDTLLSLFIVLIMALIIAWKLSGAMSMPLFNNTVDANEKIITEKINNIDKNISDNNVIEQIDSNQETNIETPVESNKEVENIKIEIPKGATGNSIAKILKEKGLIENTSEFINRVEQLKLGPKLRFGTFTIKSNSSIDDMINIITGN